MQDIHFSAMSVGQRCKGCGQPHNAHGRLVQFRNPEFALDVDALHAAIDG